MKKVVVILVLISFILLTFTGYILFFYDKVEVFLNGDDSITLDVGEYYEDKGFILKNRSKIIDSSKYKALKNSNLNYNVLGNYEIKYDINYKGKDYHLIRRINVIDGISPILDVNLTEVTKDYCTNKIDNNLKYTASDNYDGDLTEKIEVNEEDNKLIIKVKDSSNNYTQKEVKIKYKSKPSNKFSLIGNSKVNVPLNGTYKENGVKYTDGCGNKINADIKITGEVNTSEIGSYKITYETSGEKTLSRIVNVYDPSASTPFGNKIIYLTFDDGPGYYTNKILNILDKYNVKATFFVTHQFPSYLHLIKEEHNKGHAIAVHTYTHKYSIYTSVETYMDDFNKMNEVVKNYTGSYTRLFRFPGGSSNTVSKSYNKGIMTELAKRMTEDGYVYFDWNVSSGDAAGYSSSKIYSSVINGVKSCSKCVVLMHDIKSTTANALDDILNNLTSNGYTFATLNENSPTVHHSINN